MMLMAPLFWVSSHGLSLEESGDRHAFMATGGRFGGKGRNSRGGEVGGLWVLDEGCDVVYDEGLLGRLRGRAQGIVWEKTVEVLKPHL